MDVYSMGSGISPRLVSLLSESSYFVPEMSGSYEMQFQVDRRSHPQHTTGTYSTCSPQHIHQAPKMAVSLDASDSGTPRQPSKKRGRPRKIVDPGAPLTSKERRRTQVLNAQRAYQSRKEVTISSHKNRILKLEATVVKLNSLVKSLGEQLAQADALASYPHLASSLRDTVAACAALAEEAGRGKLEGHPHSPEPGIRDEGSSSVLGDSCGLLSPATCSPMQGTSPNPSRSLRDLISLQSSPSINASSQSLSATISPVELSAFIGNLRAACAHNAFKTLSDPTLSLDSIRNKFRFLLSLMSREHLTSYYKAALEARLDPSSLEAWAAVPFLGLGGAGTHYAQPSSSRRGIGSAEEKTQDWPVISDPLSDFSAQIHENLDDTWFDAHDLEGYLKEQGVRLIAYSPGTRQHNEFTRGTSMTNQAVLVNACICLGRSPGWRRGDVEEAVRKAASL